MERQAGISLPKYTLSLPTIRSLFFLYCISVGDFKLLCTKCKAMVLPTSSLVKVKV